MTDDELRLARATALIEAGRQLDSLTRVEVDTGPHRTFSLYQTPSVQQQGKPVIKDNKPLINTVVESITSFEKKRGSVLLAEEQPVLIGDILAHELEDERKSSFLRWTHLTRGFDWERVVLAGVIAASAAFIYMVARALGWVIEGFVTQTER